MTAMIWWEKLGLRQAPFSKEIADDALWLPDSKRVVVDALIEAINERQTGVVLVGEPGLGKTCVLRAVRHRLADTGARLTYCHNATLGRRDFYRQLCISMGLAPKATAASVFHELNAHVQQLHRERTHPVFLLDEAHLLHQDVLDHLHILANYEWDAKALLSIVLVGLPELWERMVLKRNRSLWSRIHCRLSLGEPDPADTAEYVRYRTKLAGSERAMFSSDAVAILHEHSAGRLRDVDRAAIAALKRAARLGHDIVDRELVVAVVNDEAPR